jgi:hypothetical protein
MAFEERPREAPANSLRIAGWHNMASCPLRDFPRAAIPTRMGNEPEENINTSGNNANVRGRQ